ncbi:MAG: phosphate transporter [Podila humilis]|nr:MAG: phosphate transporter [Podila humilis]
MYPGEYTFLFGLGMAFAFLNSYGIGANDVSNSFSAAVGSKALNLKQAVLITSVCEFLGAFLMGSSTADSIKGGLIDVALFEPQLELLLLAMVCSLVGSSTWVLFASSRGWPVSTTHAIVGAITGAGIAGFGASAVHWAEIGKIISLIAIAFYFAITIFINVFYIIFKGSPGLNLSKLPIGSILGISFRVAGAVFLWCFFFMHPYLKRKLENDEPLRWYHCLYIPFVKPIPPLPHHDTELSEKTDSTVRDDGFPLSPDNLKSKTWKKPSATGRARRLWALSTVAWPPWTTLPRSHGLFTNSMCHFFPPLGNPTKTVPTWILAYGGIVIDIGRLTYGYKVMATLGNNITYMSPSRGFSVSLGTPLTVLTCSKLGLPVITTHCITGATTAVELCSGGG